VFVVRLVARGIRSIAGARSPAPVPFVHVVPDDRAGRAPTHGDRPAHPLPLTAVALSAGLATAVAGEVVIVSAGSEVARGELARFAAALHDGAHRAQARSARMNWVPPPAPGSQRAVPAQGDALAG